jgi:hypothetical protein
MKKLVLMLAIPMLSLSLVSRAQVRVGAAIGVSAAKMEGRLNGEGRTGVMSSLVLDAPIKNNFSFLPTLSYVQKGVTEPHPAGTLISKQYVALRYMELSPNIVYHIGSMTGSSFFIGLGPSLDLNLPSKRVTITDGNKTYQDILFGPTAENDVRGMDYGVNLLMGWRTKPGFFFMVNYNKGFRDISPEAATMETKNKYFGIQLGWYLNNGKKEE